MRRFFIVFLSAILAFSATAQEKKEVQQNKLDVLVFSKTAGFRHQSISSGLMMFSDLAQKEGWTLTATEDASLFNMNFLVNFDVVVFLNPTMDVLNDKQQTAFKTFMETGKGFVGIHAATDCEYDWDWFGRLSGAYFRTHPPAQEGTLIFENFDHPAMEAFKGMESYTTFDEWYSFKENPRKNVHVLARLDESSITKPNKDNNWQMGDHPLIWWQEFDGIRSFYTGFGHTPEAFQDPKIQAHIAGAVNWAGRLK